MAKLCIWVIPAGWQFYSGWWSHGCSTRVMVVNLLVTTDGARSTSVQRIAKLQTSSRWWYNRPGSKRKKLSLACSARPWALAVSSDMLAMDMFPTNNVALTTVAIWSDTFWLLIRVLGKISSCPGSVPIRQSAPQAQIKDLVYMLYVQVWVLGRVISVAQVGQCLMLPSICSRSDPIKCFFVAKTFYSPPRT